MSRLLRISNVSVLSTGILPFPIISRPYYTQKQYRYSKMALVNEAKETLECYLCYSKISSKSSLDRHMKDVHGEVKRFKRKLYTYIFCNMNISSEPTLQRHMRTVHEGTKSFHCKVCDKRFGQISNLNEHIASFHEKRRPFSFTNCTYFKIC